MSSPGKLALNTITRSTLDAALNEVIANQRGIDFQRIGVRLARERCPSLVASEISKDGDEDAYLLATLSDGKLLSVATSITATIKKIRNDLAAIKNRKPGVETLWFYTPRAITTQKIDGWKVEIQRDFSVALEVLTREEIIGQLLDPRFHYLAYHHLGFPHPVADGVRDARELLEQSAPERLRKWLAHRIDPRLQVVGREYVADDGEQLLGRRLASGDVCRFPLIMPAPRLFRQTLASG